MKKVIFISLTIIVLGIGTISQHVSAAGKFQPVYSFKNLGEFTDSEGHEFTKLLVTCKGDPKPRYIHRVVGEKLWCVDGKSSACAEHRIDPATVACNTKVEILEQEAKKTEIAKQENEQTLELRRKLLEEQQNIEQKQLSIDARRIELQEQKLKLAKTKQN